MPNWVAILALVMIYLAVSTPLRMMRYGGHSQADTIPAGALCTHSCGLGSS